MSLELTRNHLIKANNKSHGRKATPESNLKRCPECGRRYDNTLRFCLQDGRALLTALQWEEPATLLSQTRNTDNDKYKIVAAALLVLVVILIATKTLWTIKHDVQPNQAAVGPTLEKNDLDEGAASLSVDKEIFSLDLTSSWVLLDEYKRKNTKASKVILGRQLVGVRKFRDLAALGNRIGTTSNFEPEWRGDGIHKITAEDNQERKCYPEVKYSYLLNFDISNEKINVPFNLSYEVDYWNAHNGEKGDWQAFYVSRPTTTLIIKVSFPKEKPYKSFFLKSGPGFDCKTHDLRDYPNPKVKTGFDRQTGARTITWTIDSPTVHTIYKVVWDW